MTDAEFAARLARELGALATDAAWNAVAAPGQPYGHYSDPIADALAERELDTVEAATPQQIKHLLRTALLACLDRLQVHYAADVDTSGDGLSSHDSQRITNIERVRARVAGNVATGINLRGRRRPDYSLREGNAP